MLSSWRTDITKTGTTVGRARRERRQSHRPGAGSNSRNMAVHWPVGQRFRALAKNCPRSDGPRERSMQPRLGTLPALSRPQGSNEHTDVRTPAALRAKAERKLRAGKVSEAMNLFGEIVDGYVPSLEQLGALAYWRTVSRRGWIMRTLAGESVRDDERCADGQCVARTTASATLRTYVWA